MLTNQTKKVPPRKTPFVLFAICPSANTPKEHKGKVRKYHNFDQGMRE